ncbi:MAG: glycosyltransferase family 1 protein [Gammaproteobacteria bacterium]|nr:glycosyltransferase family 1 protein [Gammaproteobacteria bacterium]
MIEHLRLAQYEVEIVHAGQFKTTPLPTYNEIKVAKNPWIMQAIIAEFQPNHIHIATEGPLGVYARWLLKRRNIPFTTSLHTKFPEYVQQRVGIPLSIGYAFMRWFHQPAVRTLCTTRSHKQELEHWGLADLVVWSRGVDIDRFQPKPLVSSDRPRLLFVGRVAIEKNIEAFLELDIDATKVVVGDGPQRLGLQDKFSQTEWLGYKTGAELVAQYAAADVFVFPSRTDTFGLVMLEANACGTPVAAYPVTGPVDVVVEGVNGCLDENLNEAVCRALNVSRSQCRAHAEKYTWSKVTQQLIDSLVELPK